MGFVRNHLPVLESLEGRLLLSAGLLPEVMSVSAPLDVPASGETSIVGQTDAQTTGLFTVTAKSGGRFVFDALGLDGTDTALKVYNSSGRLIAQNNDLSRLVRDSRVKLRLHEGESVFVEVNGSRGNYGDYSLKINSTPYDDYGNSIDSAARWRLGRSGAGSLRGAVNYAGDVDFLSVVAPVAGTMQVSLSPYRWTATDGELAIYDAAGNLIATDDNSGGGLNPLVSFDAQAGQTYYLKAFAHDGLKGDYVLRSSIQAATPPAPDPLPPEGGGSDPGVPAVPGATVMGQALQVSQGLQLLVLGTDGADVITLSQSGSTITLTTPAGPQNFEGNFQLIVVYGFGGDDTIRTMNSVIVGATIYGGAGDDSIFDNAQAAEVIYGGDGDDLMVAIGAGRDTIRGEAGLDSMWVDGTDTISDASTQETAAGAVHRVSAFYQPFTSDTSSPQYVTTTMAGQSLADPAATGGVAYVSFSNRPLFANGPDSSDVRQGGVGDCYYLAVLSSLAQTDPGTVRQMIAPMGDGTYAVRFFRGGREVYLRLDADLAVYGTSTLVYAKLSLQGETWVPLMEKAYAFFRRGQNSYASISGGWMASTYTELTGAGTTTLWTNTGASSVVSFITNQLAAGHAVTAGSITYAANPVVGSHAYEIKAIETTDSGVYVTVYNPWGIDGASFDSNSADGLLRLPLSTFMANYDGIVACQA